MYEELNWSQLRGLCTRMTRVGSADLELMDALTSMTFDNRKC